MNHAEQEQSEPLDDPGPEAVGRLTPPSRRPHLLRRLYDWVLHWADTRYASPALAAMSFAEASFFPIPPDPLLIAMSLGKRERAMRYAALCSVASVLGGVLGFIIGFKLMELVGNPIIDFYDKREFFDDLVERMGPWMLFWVFIAAFSPIPYKVFTIAAGAVAERMGAAGVLPFFLGFVATSMVGRSARFFLVAWLIHRYGEPIKRLIDKYFNWFALAFAALLVGAAVLLKYVF